VIIPFSLPATALTAGTPAAFDLTDSTDNPSYYAGLTGVPTGSAFVISSAVVPDSDGVIVTFGLSDAGGANFTPVIPLPNNPFVFSDGRVAGTFTAARFPAVQVLSKTSQTVKVAGHVELGAR